MILSDGGGGGKPSSYDLYMKRAGVGGNGTYGGGMLNSNFGGAFNTGGNPISSSNFAKGNNVDSSGRYGGSGAIAPSNYEKQQAAKKSSSGGGGGGASYQATDYGSYDDGSSGSSGGSPEIFDPFSTPEGQYLQSLANYSGIDQNALQSQARDMAVKQNAFQRGNYDNLLKFLDSTKTSRMDMLNQDLNRAIQGSQEQNFLTAMQTQQAAAARGMGGQAIMDDSALRNNMGTQKQMADFYSKNDQNKTDFLNEYDRQKGDVTNAKNALNDDDLQKQMYTSLYNNAKAEMQQKLQNELAIHKEYAPYFQTTADAQLNANTKKDIATMNNNTRLQELTEKSKQFAQDAQFKAADLTLKGQDLQNKINQTMANIDNMKNNMTNNVAKLQMDNIKQQMQFVSSRMNYADKNGMNDKDKQALMDIWNSLVGKANEATSLDVESNLP